MSEVKQVMTMVSERGLDNDDLVQVAVPRRLLPAVYRVLADAMRRHLPMAL